MTLGVLKQYTPGRPNLIQYIRYKVADLSKFISLLIKGPPCGTVQGDPPDIYKSIWLFCKKPWGYTLKY